MKRGFRSVIALPLVDEDQVFGTLGIYAGEVDAFDAQEVEILNELAGDLAFGIIALRTRNEHQRDQEERIKLESQLHQAQKMQAIGQLAGGVAHDFNNILTVIIGYGSLIKIALDNKAPINPQHADQILIAGRKAADLTQSLLAFSRKQQITLEPRSLSDIVITTGKLLGRLLTEDIELIISPSPEDPTIMADATQIDQVLINLAANARDAMPSGGRLTIETSLAKIDDDFVKSHGFGLQGNYALLSNSDTGIGMDDETKSHIFEPFFTTKEAGKGTGLGLATVYGIVKQHNGYIVVDSEPDSGTAFRIYFPLADRKYAAETNTLEKTRSGTETILIIEDDDTLRLLAMEILQAHGYIPLQAIDGDDGIRVFTENRDKIDLVLLDVVMPKKMDGKSMKH
jgi:signal transduction histidine kinase